MGLNLGMRVKDIILGTEAVVEDIARPVDDNHTSKKEATAKGGVSYRRFDKKDDRMINDERRTSVRVGSRRFRQHGP